MMSAKAFKLPLSEYVSAVNHVAVMLRRARVFAPVLARRPGGPSPSARDQTLTLRAAFFKWACLSDCTLPTVKPPKKKPKTEGKKKKPHRIPSIKLESCGIVFPVEQVTVAICDCSGGSTISSAQ